MGEEAAEEAVDGEGAAEAQVAAAAGEACLAAEAVEVAAAVTAEVDRGLGHDLHPVEALEAPTNIQHSNTAQEDVGPAVAAGHP